MDRLPIETILQEYEHCAFDEDKDGRFHKYTFSNVKGNYLEIVVFDTGNELRFIIDNYPHPRRFYNTNIPYYSTEQFESDLKRMKVEVPKRKEASNE